MDTPLDSYVLVLGCNLPLRERALAGALRASGGMKVLAMMNSVASNTIKFFDGFICADIADSDSALAAVQQYEQEYKARPEAVVPLNEIVLKSAAAISAYYQLNHNALETIEKCRDKFLMKQTFKAAGLPIPRFGAFSTLEELMSLVDEIGLPIVIKPREFFGSIGVLKVSSREEIEPAFNQCAEEMRVRYGTYQTPQNVFLVEEYIASDNEVSVEVMNHGDVHQVIAITDKYLGKEPHFFESGHTVPSIQSNNCTLKEIAEKACAVLGIQFGIAHFEARITSSGDIRIIEVAARTGGDAIMDLIERSYGVNPYQIHVASYLGIMPELPKKWVSRGLSAVSFLKAREGIIEQVIMPETLPDNIVNIQVSAKPKDISEKLDYAMNRAGSVEFFWKGRLPEKGFDEHLRMAKHLSDKIFVVSKK